VSELAIVSERKGTLQGAFIRLALIGVCLLAAWSVFDGWIWSLPRLTTTGCEEEALFPIWKFARHGTVYADPQSLPFSVSYYNWLFFVVYGGAVKILFALFSLDDSAMPAISRLVTLGCAAVCIRILYALLGTLKAPTAGASGLGRLACSILLIVNPLTSSWLFTARPDIAALACELGGVWCALQFAETRRIGPLLGAVLAAYAAWSFKQNFVHLLGGLCVWLALRRSWRELGLTLLLFAGLVGGTLLAGGTAYRHSLIGAQMNCKVSFAIAWALFLEAARLAPHLIAIVLALVASVVFRKRWPHVAAGHLFAGMATIALMVGFLGAAKQGASINYFIPASVFGMLWGLSLFAINDRKPGEPLSGLVITRWAVLATFCLAALLGLALPAQKAATEMARLLTHGDVSGNEAASGIGSEVARLKSHLNELPGPIFITDRACNLPWVQSKAPHFVYSFMYAVDRKAGYTFEAGGIGGLIEKGYFETIVALERHCACESPGMPPSQCVHMTMGHLPLVQHSDVPSLDGGRLRRYYLAFRDGAFSYYLKREP
jgi:hypothetical protein